MGLEDDLINKFHSDEITIEMECRRMSYEFVRNQTVYCSKVGEGCIYQSETSLNGLFRCMNLEKSDVWKYA